MSTSLEAYLLSLLESEPEGLGEYEILKRLRADGVEGFTSGVFLDSLTLFRAHFLLFHALYRLRERVIAERRWSLDISPLRVQLFPYRAPQGSVLDEHDALHAYYLDLANLDGTTAEDVAEMLGAFWSGVHARQRRAGALEVLDLADPVDERTVETTYRRLAMRHHPDRGGDKEAFQRLQEAIGVLRRCERL